MVDNIHVDSRDFLNVDFYIATGLSCLNKISSPLVETLSKLRRIEGCVGVGSRGGRGGAGEEFLPVQ